jgi:shikimate dehydrogenase
MTTLYGVIGNPIGHSLSPIMHNNAFQDLGLDAFYQAFEVKSNQLGNAIRGIRALGIQGFNVTIPHKVSVMEYLDDIDSQALAIGAVNTVKNRNGKLIGYNTDGIGYTAGLKTIVNQLENQNVLLVGAGGAARGIAISLANTSIKSLTITNRTIEKASSIIKKCNQDIILDVIELHHAEEKLDQFDIIINTTSVGLYPNVEEIPLKLTNIKKGTIVSDIIYNPFYTKWLHLANEMGGVVQNGIPMFVNQGALAFEIWTGMKPNLNIMENTVIEQLGGKQNVNR